MLDGLGFDNDPFLSAMADRGFEVYPESRSNYDRTPFSLLTLLTLRHLDDIDELDGADAIGGTVDQERIAGRALLGVPLFDLVEEAGYRTRVVEGPVVHAPLGGADEVTSAGSATNFELDTLQRTPLAAPLEALGIGMDQARDQVTGALSLFSNPPESPSFTFTHVMAPHAPFSFEADGSDAPAPPCYPETCAIFDGQNEGLGWSEDEHWQHMVAHVAHLNDLVVEAVDDLLAADPDAVIVIFGDHGMRVAGDSENIHRNLLLARTPGQPGLFGDAPTLVNVVPASAERLPWRRRGAPPRRPLHRRRPPVVRGRALPTRGCAVTRQSAHSTRTNGPVAVAQPGWQTTRSSTHRAEP